MEFVGSERAESVHELSGVVNLKLLNFQVISALVEYHTRGMAPPTFTAGTKVTVQVCTDLHEQLLLLESLCCYLNHCALFYTVRLHHVRILPLYPPAYFFQTSKEHLCQPETP